MNYIINHAELTHIFVISTKVNNLLNNISEDSVLQTVTVIDAEESPFDFSHLPSDKIKFEKFSDYATFTDRYPHRPPGPDSDAAIMYTSGTTGKPKGCQITHAMVIAAAAALVTFSYPFGPDDSLLSYLPLAHVLEFTLHVVAIKVLGHVAFYSGSTARIVEEIALFRPTCIDGVPRVYERIAEGIKAKVAQKPLLARAVFRAAFKATEWAGRLFHVQRLPLVQRVFGSVNAALGGRCRIMVGGGSQMPADVHNFLRIATNCGFVVGYGMTETTACVALMTHTDLGVGTCGVVGENSEARLKDVPDLGYRGEDFVGELLVRGTSVFRGYYRDEAATEAAFDRGWLRTGDIFRLTPTGQLAMVGRTRDVRKLAQGEFVSVGELQALYAGAPGVAQVYLHAGLTARFLVALVVAAPGAELTDEAAVEEFADIARKNGLRGFEFVKAARVVPEPFTCENGQMTPSMKLSGFNIERRYERELRELVEKANRS